MAAKQTDGLELVCEEMVVDGQDQANILLMESYFDFLYAKALQEGLNDVVSKNCYGCEVDHPSQVQHSCLMLDEEQHIDVYFEELQVGVKQDEILLAWMEVVDDLDISPEIIGMQKLKMCDDEWLYSMKTPAWVQKMKKMMVTIRRLERRIFH